MRSENDGRDPVPRSRQALLELETIDAGHPQVEDHAIGGMRGAGGEELLGRLECRLQERLQHGLADGLVVVHDGGERLVIPHERYDRALNARGLDRHCCRELDCPESH